MVAALSTTLAQLETAWIQYNLPNRDAFIRANFGANMTYARLVELINLEYLSGDYGRSLYSSIRSATSSPASSLAWTSSARAFWAGLSSSRAAFFSSSVRSMVFPFSSVAVFM